MTHGFKNGRLFAEQGTNERTGAGEIWKYDVGSDNVQTFMSDGSPEGVHAADKGSFAHDYTNGTVYVKTTDTLSTGWELLAINSDVPSGVTNGPIGFSSNLGISYSSPTFTVTSSDGTPLSASNPAYVITPSTVAGKKVVHTITSDISFDDDSGTSDLTGNTWGTTSGTAWTNDMPFYLYAVNSGTNSDATFMISRVPHRTLSPGAGNIAKSGSAVASTQGSFFAIDSAITVSNYASRECVCIGAFRMTKNDAANNDWTVTSLSYLDGIGRFLLDYYFAFPANQNGATSQRFSSSVGGDTIPTFTGQSATYKIDMSGYLTYFMTWSNTSVSGVGSGILRFHIPMKIRWNSSWYAAPGNFRYRNNGASNYQTGTPSVYDNTTYFEAIKSGAAQPKMTPGDITTDKSNGSFNVIYQADTA